MEFRYLAQSMKIDEQMCTKIDTALKKFHTHKSSVIAVGGQQGKGCVIDNWYICTETRISSEYGPKHSRKWYCTTVVSR
jgi:hypothetical protein